MLSWRHGKPPAESGLTHARQVHKGHGRIEERRLIAVTVNPAAVGWPGARQVVLLEAQRAQPGKPATVAYHLAVTSLPREQADAADLLELLRGHWGIENRLFHVRDVTLGEDACRVRSGQAPQVLAALRNAAVALLNQIGCTNKAAALRHHAAQPQEAIQLIRGSP